jgi:hypothetical protein
MNLRGAENTLAYTSSLPNHNGGVDYEDVDEGEKQNMKSMPHCSTTWAGHQFLTIAIVLTMWAIGVVLFSGTSNKTKVAILPKETISTKKWLRYPQQIKLHIHVLFDSSSDSDDSGDSSGDSGDGSGESGHTSDDSDDSLDHSGSSSNESGSSLDDCGSNHRSSTSDANSSSNDSSTDGVTHGSNSNDSDDMEINTYFCPMPHQRYHLGKGFHQEEEPSHHFKSHNVGVSEHHHSESAVYNKKMHHKHGNEHVYSKKKNSDDAKNSDDESTGSSQEDEEHPIPLPPLLDLKGHTVNTSNM